MCDILVAEDSFALANLLTFVLKNAGYEVDLHRNGATALEAAQQRKYSLLLLDQQMPHLTGLQVIEAIRASGPNRDTPILLCTAKSHELGPSELIERLEISQVFQKPFSPRELVTLLRETLAPTALQTQGAV
jgi:two-component system chemotaxis response regulator CheY